MSGTLVSFPCQWCYRSLGAPLTKDQAPADIPVRPICDTTVPVCREPVCHPISSLLQRHRAPIQHSDSLLVLV